MELVKKIIVSILTIVGILLAGIIICAGVLVVFPDTKIFGISYINTTSKDPETTIVSEINIGDEYTLEVIAGNYDVKFLPKSNENFTATLQNNVVGFVKELDSNKKARLNYNIDNDNKKITFTVVEPNGLFLKRETSLQIGIPQSFLDKKINIISQTNRGTTYFGSSDSILRVHNVDASCLNAKGGVKLQYAQISGDLNIKNVLGRIDVQNEIKGTVTIDSTMGTYTFGKIKDLVVVAGEGNKNNNPAIILDECNNITWNSESGSLKVKGFVLGVIKVETKNANFDIANLVGHTLIEGDDTNVHIGQVGNFAEDPTTRYNSYNWKLFTDVVSPVITINSGSGNIAVDKSYFDLALSSTKGKITVKNAMRPVVVETTSGSINVDFRDVDNNSLRNSILSGETELTQLDIFIINKYLSYLEGEKIEKVNGEDVVTYDKIESLVVTTESGPVTVNNIINSIKITAQSSLITLNYKHVRNTSDIKTSSKDVIIKAPVENFKITTKMNKTSTSKLELKFAGIKMNAYSDELSDPTRMKKYNEDEFKCLDARIGNASDSTNNIITITDFTGKISATSY